MVRIGGIVLLSRSLGVIAGCFHIPL
jgi:hypothetical protein